jgi:hypothetical protein
LVIGVNVTVTISFFEKLDETSKMTVLSSAAILVWPGWDPLSSPVTSMKVDRFMRSWGEMVSKRTRTNLV